jgi:hypothetical protein
MDNGGWHDVNSLFMKDAGCATWAEFPYNGYGGTDYLEWPTNGSVYRNALKTRVTNVTRIPDDNRDDQNAVPSLQYLNNIKSALNQGHLVTFSTHVYWWQVQNVPDYGTVAYRSRENGGDGGGHSMTIVGYDDNLTMNFGGNSISGAFKVANSWGGGWENGGFIWLMYDALGWVSSIPELNIPTDDPLIRHDAVWHNSMYYIDVADFTTQRVAEITFNSKTRGAIYPRFVYNTISPAQTHYANTLFWIPNEEHHWIEELQREGNVQLYAFNGTKTACDATIAFDISNFDPNIDPDVYLEIYALQDDINSTIKQVVYYLDDIPIQTINPNDTIPKNSPHLFYHFPSNDAQMPYISEQPLGATYIQNASSWSNLTITASVTDGGTLSYKWYKNTVNNINGASVVGGNFNFYTPPVYEYGTFYYWCIVTNTNNALSGTKVASRTSSVAIIVIERLVHTQTPNITTHPIGAEYIQDVPAISLSVSASISDGGYLSYQWYCQPDGGSSATVGTNSTTYTPNTSVIGTLYYYCVVTNTNNAVNGNKTAYETCIPAAITVVPLVNAQTPTITGQPTGATYNQNAQPFNLSVTASSPDGGILSYQWYSYTIGGNNITSVGTNSAQYLPSTATVGVLYYYVVITNTNNAVNGTKTASITSNTVTVTVNAIINAQAPSITTHPYGATYIKDGTPNTLSVYAYSLDGGNLSYQWYKNAVNSTNGGETVGTNSTTYTPSTTSTGTLYYYCVVTNTNNAVNGTTTATAASNTAAIAVVPLVNAQTPVITGQPSGAVYNHNAAPSNLSVTANVTDGGILSYQWYSYLAGGSAAPVGTNSAQHLPSTTALGVVYFYVVITNTNNSVNGTKTAAETSNTAAITVVVLVHAETPAITAQPTSAIYNNNAAPSNLSVTANIADGGVLSYQWYKNTVSGTNGATAVGTNSAQYLPSTASVGVLYYYVMITNTNDGVNGTKTAFVTSDIITVTVNALVNAQTPTITGQPRNRVIFIGETTTLSVNASVNDGGILSYQWYFNSAQSTVGAVKVSGATEQMYTVPAASATFMRWYFVTVTNTNQNVGGVKTAQTSSDIIYVLAADPSAMFTVTVIVGEGGTADPSGIITVNQGQTQIINFSASNGYVIDEVRINGISFGDIETVTLDLINENKIIYVTFKQAPVQLKSKVDPTNMIIYASCGLAGFIVLITLTFVGIKRRKH